MQRVVVQVARALQRGTPLLWVTDGFGAWARQIRGQLRTPLYTGKPGRPPLLTWPELHLVQVVKQRTDGRLSGIERRLRVGCLHRAQEVLACTQVAVGVFNTAYIERLNASLRTWIPALTRRSRTLK